MKTLEHTQTKFSGDLAFRAGRNFDRLEEAYYQPEQAFPDAKTSGDWPGDKEGRLVLALTLLSRAFGRKPKYLDRILELYPEKMNDRGYFGHTVEYSDEQQLASHGWVLRGLCEHFLASGEERFLDMAQRVVEHLAWPCRGRFADYPIRPEDREHGGEVSGTHGRRLGNWQLSTDIGAAFILLDGLAQFDSLRPRPETGELIDEMVGRFLQIDLWAIKAQTHATLTTLRALLRLAHTPGREHLVDEVETRYRLYREKAITAHHANHNWFGRPRWTEPCAIVDAIMVAVELWRRTGRSEYLEDAHLAWFNAIGHGQRPNGGFGPDTCCGANGEGILKISLFEAHFCCTMRAGEGFARAAQYGIFTEGNTVAMPFYWTGEAEIPLEGGVIRARLTSEYPDSGCVKVEVLESSVSAPVEWRFFRPSWMLEPRLTVGGKPVEACEQDGFLVWRGVCAAGVTIVLKYRQETVRIRAPYSARAFDGTMLRCGPLLMGRVNGEPTPAPIRDLLHRADATKENYCCQLLEK